MGFIGDPDYPGAIRFRGVKVEETLRLLGIYGGLSQDTPFACLNDALQRMESGKVAMVLVLCWPGGGSEAHPVFENLDPVCVDDDPQRLGYRIKLKVIRETKAYVLEIARASPSRVRRIDV